MAYTYTGVVDEITALKIEDSDIEVTFKVHGTYKINQFEHNRIFKSLKEMAVGQKALVATHYGYLKWVKPR